MSETIKIKYIDEEVQKLRYIGGADHSNWIDMRAGETLTMLPGDFRLISLNCCVELPDGYEAIVAPRSSTFKKFGLIMTNSIGVIDSSFCGNEDIWRFPALAMRKTTIYKGDRICQFRIIKRQPDIIFEEVDNLDNPSRGGVGSTGVT